MHIHLLKSKIHRARITDANLAYEGSMTIAQDLMEEAGLRPFERILCTNTALGQRFETYVIAGPRGSGAIVLNGAAAHQGKPGDVITIMSFAEVDETESKHWQPRVVVLGEKNQVVNRRGT